MRSFKQRRDDAVGAVAEQTIRRRFRLRGLDQVNMEGLRVAAGQNLKRWLAPGGWLALECGEGLASSLRPAEGPVWARSAVEKDVFGVERYLFCRRA